MANSTPRTLRAAAPILAAAALAAALAACDDNEPDPVVPADEVTAGDVADETRDALETAGEFTTQSVDNFRASMRRQLAELDRDIERLENRASELTGQARVEAEQAVAELSAMRDTFAQRLDNAQADTATAWRDLRGGLERGWDELSSATDRALDRFGQP